MELRDSLIRIWFKLFPGKSILAERSTAEIAFEQKKAGKAVILDVRERRELESGMAEGAVWLATSEIRAKGDKYQDFLKGLSKEREIFVYCAVGVRAGNFVNELTALGFKARNIGGFDEWKESGLPIALME